MAHKKISKQAKPIGHIYLFKILGIWHWLFAEHSDKGYMCITLSEPYNIPIK